MLKTIKMDTSSFPVVSAEPHHHSGMTTYYARTRAVGRNFGVTVRSAMKETMYLDF